MRTLESLAVSRRAAGSLTGLPFSLSAHAAALALVLLLPALSPPDLPAAAGTMVDRVTWALPTPPPVVPVEPVQRRSGRLPRAAGPRLGGGPVTSAPSSIPDGLPAPGDEPGSSTGPMVMDGCGDDCGGGDPNLPPGLGLPVGDPGPPAVVQAGRDVTPPLKLRHVAPLYPELAQRAGLEAQVVVECTIDPHGRIVDARVQRGHPLFDAAALEAVRQWIYTPTRVGGVPVAVLMTVTVGFRLRR